MNIVVVRSTGSGKTTLARELASCLGLRHVELDALHWDPNWSEASYDIFRERVQAALATDGWIVDGNYRSARDIVWPRAELIVMLDYSLGRVAWQLLRRIFVRGLTGVELWNGNRERIWEHFLTRKSLFLWLLRTHRRRRRDYTHLASLPENSHLRLVRLRSPAETSRWLDDFVATERRPG